MKITTIGIDLAKNVFQVHGVDEHGRAVLRKQIKRAQVAQFFSNLPPCLIGMEACGSAHHWARKLQTLGHTVKLMAPQFVKPYVKTNKNDAADAEAICEAVRRPNMRFVSVKTVEQQAVLSLHRARQGLVKARTAQANQVRGLLAEYGVVVEGSRISPPESQRFWKMRTTSCPMRFGN
jgi:transposase